MFDLPWTGQSYLRPIHALFGSLGTGSTFTHVVSFGPQPVDLMRQQHGTGFRSTHMQPNCFVQGFVTFGHRQPAWNHNCLSQFNFVIVATPRRSE